jgi:DNA-binding transcriptional LysR family regulator
MTPDQLPAVMAFARVAHHGNFTRAAAELGVSPSALSQTVRGLEQRLGVQLLHRTTRSVSITEIGKQFLERVMPALEALGLAFDELDEVRERPAGTLRLNLPRIAMQIVLAPVLAEFVRTYPDVRLDLTLDDSLVDLVAGGYDAGIRLGERLAAGMIAVRITPEQRQVVVGSPEYFRHHPPPKAPADLHQHSCVRFRYASGATYRWEFTTPGDKRQEFEMDVNGPLTVNDAPALLDAARRSIALAFVLEAEASADIAAGRLVTVLEEWCVPFPGFYLYYFNRTRLPLKLRVFIDFMRAKLEAKPVRQRKRR